MKQTEDESVDKFVARIREQGRLCEYGNALEMRVTEQVFDNSRSDELREVIIKKKLMNVEEIVQEARILETGNRNKEDTKRNFAPMGQSCVNQIKKAAKKEKCFRCGNAGHFAKDKSCTSKNKVCDSCKLVGDFRKMCKTKPENRKPKNERSKKKVWQVQDSEDESGVQCGIEISSEDSDDDVQHIYATGSKHDLVELFVDTGAHVNVISRTTWSTVTVN
ncbi:uncharacterized protein LOC135703583 [Ochlerotatus camptorhynchus]|uniref:uncharacterized protein LOC135703583 n=1 Tax=Ochlerotatus camptorhynchus TaxID=644619 RepID=UPI0031D2FE0C